MFRYRLILLLSCVLLLSSCGNSRSGKSFILEGTLDIETIQDASSGPLFVTVLHELPADIRQLDLSDVVKIVSVDPDTLEFSITLPPGLIDAGDTLFIAAFQDVDFTGTPALTPGDWLGFYSDPMTHTPEYTVSSDVNSGIGIRVSREVFSYEAGVSGTISGEGEGTVTVVAYAGDITSLDFNQINPDEVIGYKTVNKTGPVVSYQLPILPIGSNVPVDHVFLFAFLDVNGNGMNDSGDLIGYIQREDGMPGTVTITEGLMEAPDLMFVMDIPEPSGDVLYVRGTFDIAAPLSDQTGKRFILIMEADPSDQGNISMDGSTVRYFSRLPDNALSFDVDISSTGLSEGDDVMVTLLIDNDYTKGFPSMSAGDYLGFFQNTSDFGTSVSLNAGVTTITPEGDWAFDVNRVVYDHHASVGFELDDSNLNTIFLGVSLDPGEHVTALAVHEAGLTVGLTPSIDMNYVVGTASLTVPHDGNDGYLYEMNMLPALHHSIDVGEPFSLSNIYIIALFDGNVNDSESKNNYLGYYWKPVLGFMQIAPYPEISDGLNRLDRSVRFTTRKYTF